jgi:large-conductance mechanosensitive channel
MYSLKLFFIFFFCLQLQFAQQDSLTINYDDSKLDIKKIEEKDLEKYKADDDFKYIEEVQKENILQKIVRWIKNVIVKFFEAIFGVGKASGLLYFIFNILPYLLLAFLVFMLVKFFLKVNSRNIIYGEQKGGEITFTDEEQIIKNEDINALITEAIKQKNYRLAIRYYYLQTLKFLTEKNSISWQPQKTNEDYIKEIGNTSILSDFKNLTKIYDYVWYGEFNIDNLKFETLKNTFETINKSIKKTH